MTIATASYGAVPGGWQVVATSVGLPTWIDPLPILQDARPFGLFGRGLDADNFTTRYIERLEKNWARIEVDLKYMVSKHQRVALGCWEAPANAHRCHRRLLARFIEGRMGLSIPELGVEPQLAMDFR